MSRIARKILFDKDIRGLEPKNKRYRVVAGNPSGIKSFALRICNNGREKHIPLNRFRQGIYSVAEARKEACEKLKIVQSGEELNTQKYLFKNLYEAFIAQKRKRGRQKARLKPQNLFVKIIYCHILQT